MEVRLISHSDLGPLVCGYAAKVCTSAEMPECPEELAVTRREGEVSPFGKALANALNSHHDSVLEHWSATFAIEGISRACSHQLVRHRVASYSQQSQRFVRMDEPCYVNPMDGTAQLASLECTMKRAEQDRVFDEAMRNAWKAYVRLIELGWKDEDARYVLPNACTTNIVVTMNARELRHFLGLRLCKRAQKEIRELAERMLECLKDECPELFEDVGPQCEQLGYCPEEKGCGRYPDLFALGEEYWIGHRGWRSS